MAAGGVAELLFGVRAERTPLENIARPITVADAGLTRQQRRRRRESFA
jgi:hypothetical protein